MKSVLLKTYKNNIYLTKFEKDHFSTVSTLPRTTLDYTFVQAFPLNLTAIPVSYEDSQILKCSVSFNFIRYVMERKSSLVSGGTSLFGSSSTTNAQRDIIINRDPTLGANELLGTTQTFA